ncbi:MAG: YraN family protein [Pseudomonadota bacterium]
MGRTQTTGNAAETLAARHLEAHGLRIRARNVRRPWGELDLVAQEHTTLVLVEVRKRSHPGFGGAAASIDRGKRARLLRSAEAYLQELDWRGPVRFDVIAVDGEDRVDWLQDAIQAEPS